jgi:thiol-disulfide isomerase/thioredoxin
MSRTIFISLLLVYVACTKAQESVPLSSPQPSQPATSQTVAATGTGAEIVLAEAGDVPVDLLVKAQMRKAALEQRQLIVYVGAQWCKPCIRFHKAALAGKLDRDFPTLRLLEFDLDRDAARLKAAGYQSSLVPLFTLPRADGRASERFIQGSIKGDGAVANIAARLKKLLEQLGPSLN